MYISTRGNDKQTASKAIICGLAKDGGLFVLKDVPKINIDFTKEYSYKDIAKIVLKTFLDDFSEAEIDEAINGAYSSKNFKPDMVGFDLLDEFAFLNLYNGPTFAFKDMALTMLPYLLDIAKRKNNVNDNTVVLTATSGDTGSAALSGFKQIKGNFVIVLYPNNAVSKIQELQMLSFKANNAFPIAVNGNFDDCQKAVKTAFQTIKHDKVCLSSANSINIGRLVPQIVYYYYSYYYMIKNNKIKMNDKLNFCVPTGNFGNILACYLAKKSGLPVGDIICASNENNVLTDFFNTGVYNSNRKFKVTNSPSMDILVSSNLERYLYYLCGDCNYVKQLMNELNEKGRYEVDERMKEELSSMHSSYVDEAQTVDAIKECFKNNNVLIDPHTAVAYQAYLNVKNKLDGYTVVVSTASPYKFNNTICDALNIDDVSEFENINEISKRTNKEVDQRILDLKNINESKMVCDKEDILNQISSILERLYD